MTEPMIATVNPRGGAVSVEEKCCGWHGMICAPTDYEGPCCADCPGDAATEHPTRPPESHAEPLSGLPVGES